MLDKLFGRYHELVFEKDDMIDVSSILNDSKASLVRLKACKWEEDLEEWIVGFTVSKKNWAMITEELNNIGQINLRVSPDRKVRLYYSKAEA